MSISQAIYINIILFVKLNVHQFAFTFQFAQLSIYVGQTYRVYGMLQHLDHDIQTIHLLKGL